MEERTDLMRIHLRVGPDILTITAKGDLAQVTIGATELNLHRSDLRRYLVAVLNSL